MDIRALLEKKIRPRPGLSILLILLTVIAVMSLKPSFAIFGWDNYSSFFHPEINIPRTLFSTWREHRGLGVPSDSEVVDVFRQLFSAALRPLTGENLTDQLYYLVCLVTGVLGMYGFAFSLSDRESGHESKRKADLFGFIAAFFYLFNLNTLSVFYFPIVTYITRFAFLPVLCWWFYLFLTNRRISGKLIAAGFVVFLFSSGSYITGTVFITNVITLAVFAAWFRRWKRMAAAFAFFILVNAFWLLPFANYTLQKSPIIRLAPTFIDANESQLNKPAAAYSVDKQLVLYPNFFDTKYFDSESGEELRFHPLAQSWGRLDSGIGLWVFPVLYVAGSVIILMRWKRNRHYLFIPVIIAAFLFLSFKEYSPLGWLYSFLDRYLPYFAVLFRFGDTKFHPYIAFNGALAAAYAILSLTERFRRSRGIRVLAFLVYMLPVLYAFRTYFTGDLVGRFMYNRLPEAYREITDQINAQPSTFRVLHLPYDRNAYWRSYAWGELGSSFLHYLLKKPLFEKTFEPGSMENVHFDDQLTDLLADGQSITDSVALTERAREVATLLKKANVRYVILDSSVAGVVPVRQAKYWGVYSYFDNQKILNAMADAGLVRVIKSSAIDIQEAARAMAALRPLSGKTWDRITADPTRTLTLYELEGPEQTVTFPRKATVAQNSGSLNPVSVLLVDGRTVIEPPSGQGTVFPFLRPFARVTDGQASEEITFDGSRGTAPYALMFSGYSGTVPGNLLRITARRDVTQLTLAFYEVFAPAVNDGPRAETKVFEYGLPLSEILKLPKSRDAVADVADDWHVLPVGTIGPLRLDLDGTVLPLPADLPGVETDLGYVVVHTASPRLSLLGLTAYKPLLDDGFRVTDEPNCFYDKTAGFRYEAHGGKAFTMSAANGSVCAYQNLTELLNGKLDYAEIEFVASGQSKSGEGAADTLLKKSLLTLPRPGRLRACIRGELLDTCINKHDQLIMGNDRRIIVPFDQPATTGDQVLFFVSLSPFGEEELSVKLEKPMLRTFDILDETSFSLPSAPPGFLGTAAPDKELTLTLPKALSPYSFYFNPGIDSWYSATQPCGDGAYRTVRMADGVWVSGTDNCYNELFVQNQYSDEAALLWTLKYRLLSGKFPMFQLSDRFRTPISRYASIYQGYPDIPGFKSLQSLNWGYRGDVKKEALSGKFATASIWVGPSPGLEDETPKRFTIHQDSENIGLIAISGIDILEYPNWWRGLSLAPADSERNFGAPSSYTYSRILPSVWRVRTVTASEGRQLLRFSQGYDRQWILSDSLAGAILGISAAESHGRCDGLVNCFEVDARPGKTTYYLVYRPETLSFLGWMVTIGTGIFAVISARRFLRSSA